MTPLELHHVAIQTSDLERALRFYLGALGGEMLERQKFKKREMAWIRVGNLRIELYSKREGEELRPWEDYYSGPVHIAFAVPDLDAFLAEALAKGASFHPSHPEPFVPPAPGAGRMAYLLGPDGEELEIRGRDDSA
jgi:catechol 2,3-dioxygenase-like lactoylglutathione lyase family enzyme